MDSGSDKWISYIVYITGGSTEKRRMGRQTDRPSYRIAYTQLKREAVGSRCHSFLVIFPVREIRKKLVFFTP